MGREGKEERPKKKRREKSNPLEVELELSGKFTRENMMRRSLENENGARTVSVNGFKRQEDLKMYIRLPDYDDFQGYGPGPGGGFKSNPP